MERLGLKACWHYKERVCFASFGGKLQQLWIEPHSNAPSRLFCARADELHSWHVNPQTTQSRSMRRFRVVLILCGFFIISLFATSGRFLVVNQPRKSDVIVVSAGEADRWPALGLKLLDQGYASRLILDVPARRWVYAWNQMELAQEYVQGLPQSKSITICPIYGLSIKDEARDVSPCLQSVGARSVLLITSEPRTRRALSTFSRELSDYDFSVAAAFDAREFGVQWWRHRDWAKLNFDEWVQLMWWELIDRWR
jgi:uncharacterized SAM-binding protein YcdF (DUF218 family)